MSRAICKTCGGEVPFGHKPSELDPLGAGHPMHELEPRLSDVLTNDTPTNTDDELDEILDGIDKAIETRVLREPLTEDAWMVEMRLRLKKAVTTEAKQAILAHQEQAVREARIDELEQAIVHVGREAQTPQEYLKRALQQLTSKESE